MVDGPVKDTVKSTIGICHAGAGKGEGCSAQRRGSPQPPPRVPTAPASLHLQHGLKQGVAVQQPEPILVLTAQLGETITTTSVFSTHLPQ